MSSCSKSASEQMKVIIVGAGWSGLATAKTYLQLATSPSNPWRQHIELTVLDDNETPGGVWSRERLYPGLYANSPNGLYEFSDFSMVDEEHPRMELITGKRVQGYLEAYARHFGIFDRIRFGITVIHISQDGDGWALETSSGEKLYCDKLVVCTGLHSKLKLPSIATSSDYTGISIHSKLLGQMCEKISSDTSVKDIVVVGGCKSAIEACSIFLDTTVPKRVHWVVRPSEQGVPILIHDPKAKIQPQAVNNTRLFSIFSPSVFITSGFWYSLLHSGKWLIGIILMRSFWIITSFIVRAGFGYGNSENAQKIEPRGRSLFFDVPYISLVLKNSKFAKTLHSDDYERFRVYRATPIKLVGKMMIIENGQNQKKESLKADAVIWCTGWRPSLDFFDERSKMQLGLPHLVAQKDEETVWSELSALHASEAERQFPFMSGGFIQSRTFTEAITTTPFRLYQNIIPVSCLSEIGEETDTTRSIAFNSFCSSSQTAIVSEISALYAVAWLEGLLPASQLPCRYDAMASICKVQAWRSLRYGQRGTRDPEIILEIQGLLDHMCEELGVKVERKRTKQGKSLFREWIEPYRASDYQGIVEEFLSRSLE